MLQKIAMLANSTSSDMLGGRLIKAIKKLNPLVQFIGYGGYTHHQAHNGGKWPALPLRHIQIPKQTLPPIQKNTPHSIT
jgi:lipid A disaccharide synthetase